MPFQASSGGFCPSANSKRHRDNTVNKKIGTRIIQMERGGGRYGIRIGPTENLLAVRAKICDLGSDLPNPIGTHSGVDLGEPTRRLSGLSTTAN